MERALKHVFLSVDAPVGNFTHVTAGDETFRDFVCGVEAWNGRLSPHVASLTRDTAHAFDFEPQEFYRRVVQVYDVDDSNFMPYAPSVGRIAGVYARSRRPTRQTPRSGHETQFSRTGRAGHAPDMP
ncbi:MAG: hypothetical protein AB1730_20905 [Myxococcota bacterium]